MTCISLRSALASAFGITLRSTRTRMIPLLQSTSKITQHEKSSNLSNNGKHSFSTTGSLHKAKGEKREKVDKRITMIRYSLYHPTTLMPRPLRFSRDRYLRHWTIHRAWNLYRHKVKKQRELELERQYNAMAAANEELRLGAGDGGRLFRKAQMKTGVWSIPERGGGVPIEYARAQAEWIGTVAGGVGGPAKVWDTTWTRH